MSGHRPRVAVVTGAASGIGAACVERLTGHVEHLVLVDRTAAPLEAAAERLTESTTTGHPVVADLTDPGAGEQVAAAVTALGTLRSVAHVAGISPTMGDWRSIVDVDLVATAAHRRWSVPEDLIEALERVAAETVLAAAQAGDALERVEEEMFRFGRVLARERRVRDALTDRLAEEGSRAVLIGTGQAHPKHSSVMIDEYQAARSAIS